MDRRRKFQLFHGYNVSDVKAVAYTLWLNPVGLEVYVLFQIDNANEPSDAISLSSEPDEAEDNTGEWRQRCAL